MELVDLRTNTSHCLCYGSLLQSEKAIYFTGWTGRARKVLYRYWIMGLDPSTAATAIMDSHLHIARGPFLGHVRGAGGLGVGVWSFEAKAKSTRG